MRSRPSSPSAPPVTVRAATVLLPQLRTHSDDVDATRALAGALRDAWRGSSEGQAADVRDLFATAAADVHIDARDARAGIFSASGHPPGLGSGDALDSLRRAIESSITSLAASEMHADPRTVSVRTDVERLLHDDMPRIVQETPATEKDVLTLAWRAITAGELIDSNLLLAEALRLGEPAYLGLQVSALRRSMSALRTDPWLTAHQAATNAALEAAAFEAARPLPERDRRGCAAQAKALDQLLPDDEAEWGTASLLVVGIENLLTEVVGEPADIHPVWAARGVAEELAKAASSPSGSGLLAIAVHPAVVEEARQQESDLLRARPASHD